MAGMATFTEAYGITALRMDDILHLKGVKIGKVIGMGAFGTMLRVKHGEDEYAAKRMNESLLVEKFTLRSLKDFCRKCVPIFSLAEKKRTAPGADNVVKYIGIYQDDPNAMPLLVMELMHIDLRYMLHLHKDTITFRDEVNIAHDIATGLHFLHCQVPEILHRNLHANNILLDPSFKAKIADLMNVKLIPPEYILKKEITSIPGHEEYLPPEIFHDVRSYTACGDVFSLGVVILEILTRKAPRPIRNLKLPEVQRRKTDLSLVAEDNLLLAVVYSCIKDHDSERPSAGQVSDELAEIKKTLQYAVCASAGGAQASISELLLTKRYQLKWEKTSTIPVGMSGATALKSSDGKVYIGGGWTSEAATSTSISVYNPTNDYWSTLPSCPVQYGCLTLVGKDKSSLIVVGGILATEWKTTNLVFSYENKHWSEVYPAMSVPRLNPAVAVYAGRYVLVAGGLGRDHSLDTIEVLDIEKSEWRPSDIKLPQGLQEAKGSICGDNFVIIGQVRDTIVNGGTTDQDEEVIFSIPVGAILGESPGTVTILAPPPHQYSTLVPSVTPPMLIGGIPNNDDELPGVFVYDNQTTSWIHIGMTTCARVQPAVVSLHGGAILLLGGVSKSTSLSKETVIREVETGYLDNM